jgi:succinate dehydrogenase / fumarate reductase cytochrome b subunit
MAQNRTFLLRRVHSLAGVVPMGLFLVEHLFVNSYALKGAVAYDQAIAVIQSVVYVTVIEVAVILTPLAIHGVYGMWLAVTARNNVLGYSYLHNWLFLLQRVSGVVTFVFVAYHLWALRLSNLFFGTEISFATVASQMASPLTLATYAVGLVASVFHFAHGLATFSITWGITIGPNSRRVVLAACSGIFVVMSLVGMRAIIAFL